MRRRDAPEMRGMARCETEDERAECGPDDRAVPTGEQGSTDDHGDDRVELLELSPKRIGPGETHGLEDRDQPGAQRRRHEQADLHPGDGYADVDLDSSDGCRSAGADTADHPGADGDVDF